MAKYCTFALLALASLASFAAIPVRWSTDAYKVKPLVYDCYHGETLDLAASLTAYGEPLDFAGKTAKLYWQTNGMASAWWSTNAEVRAEFGSTNILATIWSGSYDTGAKSVTGFIGVEGENYRAAFQLNFRDSPGFRPNSMPAPSVMTAIDWSKVVNYSPECAPFVRKGEGGLTPNDVTNIVDTVVASSNLSSVAYTDASSATTLASANAYTISATNLLRRVTDMAVYAEGVRPEGPWTWSGEDTNLVYWLNHDAKIPVYNAEGRNTWDLPIYGYHGWYIFGGGQTGDFNAETIEIIAMKEPELEDSTTIYATRPRIVGPTADRLATTNQLLATSNAIPTNVSQLNNDSGFISDTDPYSGRTIGWNFEDDTFRFNTPITFGSDGSISLTSWRDVYVGFEHLPTMTTNAAESVFAANADYALTNLTGATVALASGQIGNLALDGATSNLTVTLDFSAATDRSGDAMLYLVNAADTFLAIAPAASVTPIGYTASEAMKAGTNIVLMTRMTYSEGKSVVNVAIKEVK